MKNITATLIAFAAFTAPAFAKAPLENTYGYKTSKEATASFNLKQAEFARKQLAENAESKRTHDEAVKRLEAYEAEKTRLANEHKMAMEQWRTDVAACKSGNWGKCAKD